MDSEKADYRMIPPHTHTPDEVQWDSMDFDPNEPARMGHVLTVHDRTTEISRRVFALQEVQRKQAAAIVLLSFALIFSVLAYRRVKRNG